MSATPIASADASVSTCLPDVDCHCKPTYPIRIVAAEQHVIFRDALCQLLASQPGFVVVGGAGSGDETVRMVTERRPDTLLLDLAIRDGSALEVLEALRGSGARVRPILLADGAGSAPIVEAVRLGACGMVSKTTASALLYKCIRCVAAGDYWFGSDQMPPLIDALRQPPPVPAPSPVQTLTHREIEVIVAIVDGATNRMIADQLGLSDQTVKNHLSHIYDKVGVSNRLELALYAIHHKLLDRLR
jgi:two-component system, NarL family, nitrate/nitrite response regulator NarL